MTQRERVLRMLEEAGPSGVRSDTFIANYMPRAAARVQELKGQGFPISSEREGKYVRWTLNVGVGAEGLVSSSREARGLGDTSPLSTDSGVECSASHIPPRPGASSAPPELIHHIPSAYEVWVDDEAA